MEFDFDPLQLSDRLALYTLGDAVDQDVCGRISASRIIPHEPQHCGSLADALNDRDSPTRLVIG